MLFRVSLLALVSVPWALLAASSQASAQEPAAPRQLAPGVLRTIPPAPRQEETFSGPVQLRQMPTVDFEPHFAPKTETLHERGKHVILRRQIWNHEFSFKPLRTIEAEVPQPNGKLKRKLIWYLVYRVRRSALAIGPTPQADEFGHQTFVPGPVSQLEGDLMSDRFYPLFVLEGWAQQPLSQRYERLAYTDRVIPGVIDAIRQKEDPATELLNSVEISQRRIPAYDDPSSDGLWGVATWEDVDPRLDYLSVFVAGLTNAFRFRDLADGERVYKHKVLQLNFYRPGDTVNEARDKIRYGLPLVVDPLEQVRILQLYQIPGPTIEVVRFEPTSDRETHLFTLDPQLSPRLQSPLRQQLNEQRIPEEIRQEMARSGITIPEGTVLRTFLEGQQWEFTVNVGGQSQAFRIRYQPAYWDFTPGGLEIKERLDHLWVYR